MNTTDEYIALGHAIQSAVKVQHEHGAQDGSPKHLRTGLNLVMRDLASLVGILVQKGLISSEEYEAALLVGLREELEMQTQEARIAMGLKANDTSVSFQ